MLGIWTALTRSTHNTRFCSSHSWDPDMLECSRPIMMARTWLSTRPNFAISPRTGTSRPWHFSHDGQLRMVLGTRDQRKTQLESGSLTVQWSLRATKLQCNLYSFWRLVWFDLLMVDRVALKLGNSLAVSLSCVGYVEYVESRVCTLYQTESFQALL